MVTGGKIHSNAIRRLNVSRVSYALFYGILIFLILALTIFIPFWIWLIGVVIFGFIFRFIVKKVDLLFDKKRFRSDDKNLSRNTHPIPNWWQKFVIAPEKYLGVYLGK